jgi:hypothetical protein
MFWVNLQHVINLLQPFSDFIHQIEADRPALGRCYAGLMKLDEHVRNTVKSWQGILDLEDEMEGVLKTWERRLEGEHGGGVVQLLDPAYIAAYIVDPLYAVASPTGTALPMVPLKHEDQAKKLVKRVGGPKALRQFCTF